MKALAVVLLLFCISSMAQAHRVNINARPDGNMIVGTVYFTGGGVAENIDVDIFTEDGVKLAPVKTNSKGEFLFLPNAKDTQYTFIVDTGDGHAARTTLSVGSSSVVSGASAARKPAAAQQSQRGPAAGQASAMQGSALQISIDPAIISGVVAAELSKQLGPVVDKLDKHDSRISFANVIGGLGFIFGIFGIAAILWTRRLVLADIKARKAAKDAGK